MNIYIYFFVCWGVKSVWGLEQKTMSRRSLRFYRDGTTVLEVSTDEINPRFPILTVLPGQHSQVYVTLSSKDEKNAKIVNTTTRVRDFELYESRDVREYESDHMELSRDNVRLFEKQQAREIFEEEERRRMMVEKEFLESRRCVSRFYTNKLQSFFGPDTHYLAMYKPREHEYGAPPRIDVLSWKDKNVKQFQIEPHFDTEVHTTVEPQKASEPIQGAVTVYVKCLLYNLSCSFEHDITFPSFSATGTFAEIGTVDTKAVVTIPPGGLDTIGKRGPYDIYFVDRDLPMRRRKHNPNYDYTNTNPGTQALTNPEPQALDSYGPDEYPLGNEHDELPNHDPISEQLLKKGEQIQGQEGLQNFCYIMKNTCPICSVISWIRLDDDINQGGPNMYPDLAVVFQEKLKLPLPGRSILYMDKPEGPKVLLGYKEELSPNVDFLPLGKDHDLELKVVRRQETNVNGKTDVEILVSIENKSSITRHVAILQQTKSPVQKEGYTALDVLRNNLPSRKETIHWITCPPKGMQTWKTIFVPRPKTVLYKKN